MTRYYSGLNRALTNADSMDVKECLSLLDSLYGRAALKYGDGINELREELKKQLRRDYTIPDEGI